MAKPEIVIGDLKIVRVDKLNWQVFELREIGKAKPGTKSREGEHGGYYEWNYFRPGGDGCEEYRPHHVKPRTIEDVLRDCCDEWNEHCGDDWEQGVYVKYAAELRELMGGDAE